MHSLQALSDPCLIAITKQKITSAPCTIHTLDKPHTDAVQVLAKTPDKTNPSMVIINNNPSSSIKTSLAQEKKPFPLPQSAILSYEPQCSLEFMNGHDGLVVALQFQVINVPTQTVTPIASNSSDSNVKNISVV